MEICERIAQGETLISICQDPRMPPRVVVLQWALGRIQGDDDPKTVAFPEMYERARRLQAEVRIDELFELADNPNVSIKKIRKEFMNKRGELVETEEEHTDDNVARSKLQVDTRQWFAAQIVPKLYGRLRFREDDNGEGVVRLINDPDEDATE